MCRCRPCGWPWASQACTAAHAEPPAPPRPARRSATRRVGGARRRRRWSRSRRCSSMWSCWAARTRRHGRNGSLAWDRCGQCGPVGQWGWGGAGDSAGGGQGHGMPPRQLHLPPAARTPARAAPRLPACTVQAAGVPKLFRHSGRVRNKHLSKRDTEKLVKEIWRERMADPGREVAGGLDGGGESHAECCSCCGACGPCCPLTAAPLLPRCLSPAAALAGTAVDLLEFVFQQLQKKVGIMTAVVEVRGTGQWGVARRWARRAVVAGRRRARSAVVAQAARPTPAAPPPPPQAGYNFLYGLWRYQWDADCELFLRILLVCGGGGGAAAALGGAGPPPGWPAWHPAPHRPSAPSHTAPVPLRPPGPHNRRAR